MTTLDVLREARRLIETPDRWSRKTAARLADGEPCLSSDPNAHSFCVAGAVYRASCCSTYGRHYGAAMGCILGAIVGDVLSDVPAWNDANGRTHAEVLDVFDRAIAKLEAA